MRKSRPRPAVVALLAFALSACGSTGGTGGKTTCGQFIKKSEAERMKVINDWLPSLTPQQKQNINRDMFETCSNRDITDPSDRLEDSEI